MSDLLIKLAEMAGSLTTGDAVAAGIAAAALIVSYKAYKHQRQVAEEQDKDSKDRRARDRTAAEAAEIERARKEILSLGCGVQQEIGDDLFLVVSVQNSGTRTADHVFWHLLTPNEPNGLVKDCIPHAGHALPTEATIDGSVFTERSTQLAAPVHVKTQLNFATIVLHKPTLVQHPCDILWRFSSAAGPFPEDGKYGGIRVAVPPGTEQVVFLLIQP